MHDERPNWHHYFGNIALAVSVRASCPRLSVGAVMVRNKRIIATAYNGAPMGSQTCLLAGCDVEHNHCMRARHAEENLVSVCARYGISTKGTEVYCTHEPCRRCVGILQQAGVHIVYFLFPYPEREIPRQTVKENLTCVHMKGFM